jgi:hypothetical protein
METTQHQEWRSRQRIDVGAVLKASIATGLLFFVLSGGSPWSTAGTMNAVMGRDLPLNLYLLAAFHFGLAIVYMFIIAAAIYRFRTPMAVPLGIAVGMALYAINFVIYSASGVSQKSPEFRPIMVHLMFALFASLIYKAMSVPKPLKT